MLVNGDQKLCTHLNFFSALSDRIVLFVCVWCE